MIAWMKLRPFLNKTVSRIFIGTVILTIPYWITEIYANFAFFHNQNDLFVKTRPFEALCRDPWWIAAALFLMYNIKTKYDLSLLQIVRISPRFAVMLGAMLLSIIFIILDVCSVTGAFESTLPVGINPFWKLSFVFKCLTDSVVLDDFKTALDRLRAFKISRLGSFAGDGNDMRSKEHHEAVFSANNWNEPPSPSQGGLSDMPAVHEPSRPEHWRKINPGTAHVEDSRPEVVRLASRDRDVDEAGVHVVDHRRQHHEKGIPENDELSTDPLDGWVKKSSETSSDPDLEYAMACRQVASHDRRTELEHASHIK